MTNDELNNLPMYSGIHIDLGYPGWQFDGVLVEKYMPANTTLWQGLVFVSQHNGKEMHNVIWANVMNMTVTNIPSPVTGGITPDQKSKLTAAVGLINEVVR